MEDPVFEPLCYMCITDQDVEERTFPWDSNNVFSNTMFEIDLCPVCYENLIKRVGVAAEVKGFTWGQARDYLFVLNKTEN